MPTAKLRRKFGAIGYLAKPLILKIAQCSSSGTYLRWLTGLGTWEGWLFPGDVDTKTKLGDSTSLATADARATVAVRWPGTDTLTLRAGDLSEVQAQALSTLLDSPQVYQQFADNSRVPVLVVPDSNFSRTSADGKHELELSILLPARNALTY